jgi:pyruvate/2-oxoglutarate/acetoin dehydrogenase E1 component
MGTYYEELRNAMTMLAKYPRSIFLGQSVREKGTGMTDSFSAVSREKLLELPVAEDLQLGLSIGLALDGMLPVSVYPRWNFLLLATNQLVLHLDKLPLYSAYKPKVIIRVAVGTDKPLDPGPQHLSDYSAAFRLMLRTVEIVQLKNAAEIVPAYRAAAEDNGSTILVEYPSEYSTEL